MWTELLLFVLTALVLSYLWVTRKYGSFRAKGVPEIPAMFPFGAREYVDVFLGGASIIAVINGIYKQYKKLPVVGMFQFGSPILVVNDVEMIKQVMVKDFDHFTDRRTFELNDNVHVNKYFKNMLTNLEGDKWRAMRSTMSPVFTTGKLKAMAVLVNEVSKDLTKHLTEKARTKEELAAKELFVSYMLDTIGKVGFGVEAKSFTQKDNQLRTMVDKLTGGGKPSIMGFLRLTLLFTMPKVAKALNVSFFDIEASEFLVNIMRQSLEQRKRDGIKRNDFIDLTLDALRHDIQHESESNDQYDQDAKMSSSSKIKAKDQDELEVYLISNLFLLFFAGFDTSSTALTIITAMLAKNPEVQQKVYEEIMSDLTDEELEEPDYNSVTKLKYLDMVFDESFRYYAASFIERKCTKPWRVPGTDYIVEKGMMVQFPSGALMKDPEFWEKPDEFYPEHFSAEAKKERSPYAFMIFGQGPRNCIGMRFAQFAVKACLIRMLKDFEIKPGPQMPAKLEIDPRNMQGLPKGGVWIQFEKRK